MSVGDAQNGKSSSGSRPAATSTSRVRAQDESEASTGGAPIDARALARG
jgi:hypothetical protein